MGHLSFHAEGRSHGPALHLQLTGLPPGLPFPSARIDHWLKLRRSVAGRGPRAPREPDGWRVESGVADGVTTGDELAVVIDNGDRSGQSVDNQGRRARLEFPRPGHADLAGALKWNLDDASPVAELASARLTAAYAVLGACCQEVLVRAGMVSLAHVMRVGQVADRRRQWNKGFRAEPLLTALEGSPLLFLDSRKEAAALAALAEADRQGDTLGGIFEVVVAGVPPGLGAPQPLAQRLDSRLAAVVMGIPGVSAVALGDGFESGRGRGSAYHPALHYDETRGYTYERNRSGGIEGGMTNGHPLVLRAMVKPLASMGRPVASVSLMDQRPGPAAIVRSDICAVAPAAIVARSLVAFVLADALLDEATSGGK